VPGTKNKNSRYVNVRTNTLVEVFAEGSGTLRIATVSVDGYGRRRTAPATSFHPHYLDGNGRPRSSGYVPVNSLPGDHPRAMKTEIDRMELLENLDSLSDDELREVIAEQQRIFNDTKTLIERAKEIAKKRRKVPGLELHGDTAFVYSPNRKFDAATARRVLDVKTLANVSVSKPDATRAKQVLGEDSDLYKACVKESGLKLEVREATDEDRLRVLDERTTAAPETMDEDFDPDEPPF
jgi:hypothetical protein